MKKWLSQYRFPTPLLWTKIVLFVLLIFSIIIPSALVLALHAVPIENMAVAIGADVSVGRTFQRDTFYAAGRAWAFYMGYDPLLATHIYFKSSTDGVNWQPRSQFCDVVDADDFSLHWDGTYIHVVWVDNTAAQSGVSYRRGTPNSNGTITWVATQEVRIPSLASGYVLPTITSYAGRPYLAYGHLDGAIQVWAAESSNVTTGLWSSDLAFRRTDINFGNATIAACIDALPSSGIIHITTESTIAPDIFPEVGAVTYIGGWQAYETVMDTGAFGDFLCSTVPWGDVVNVITNFVPGNDISHRQSGVGGIWGVAPPPTIISLNSYIHATVGIWDNTDGDLKCFFSDGLPGDISWKHYDNVLGAWDLAFISLVTAHADKLNSAQIHASPMGVVYEDNLAPDSDIVYYDYLDHFPASPAVAAAIANLNFWIYMIALVLAGIGILWLFSSQEIGTVVAIGIMLTIGVIICMSFLQ